MRQHDLIALRWTPAFRVLALLVLFLWPQVVLAHGGQGSVALADGELYVPPPNAGWWDIVYGMLQHHVRAMLDMAREGDQIGPIVSVIVLAFGYGILHAVGPGHGKLLLVSYMTATGASAGIGIAIAVAAALIQGLVAILIVLVLSIGLNGLADFIPALQGYVNIASLILLAVLGLTIALRQLNAFNWLPDEIARITPTSTCGCGSHGSVSSHTHNREPMSAVTRSKSVGWLTSARHNAAGTYYSRSEFFEAATLAVSMGARPCTSAFAILLVALGQGMLALGIAATVVMSFGVAVALILIAVLSVDLRERASGLRYAWLPKNTLGFLSLSAGLLLMLVAVMGLVGTAT